VVIFHVRRSGKHPSSNLVIEYRNMVCPFPSFWLANIEALGKFPFPSFWTSQLSILERWFVPTRAFWVSQISQSHIIEI
jgi:hypothetical protein